MRALQLPTVSDKRANRRMYNRASQLITDSFKTKEPLEHYSCVLRHLRDHVTGDPEFASDYGLQEAAEQRAWRSAESTLLPLGAALRNLPAHGATAYGEPEEWAEERTDASARRLTRGAHAARLGSRGLLLSVQQLLATATVTNTHSDFEAEEFGWWTKEGDGGWQRRAAPSSVQVLHVAHLNPPPDFD